MAKSRNVKTGVDRRRRCFPLGVGAQRDFARTFGFLGEDSTAESITGRESCDMRGSGKKCRITGEICPRRNVSASQ